MSLWYPKKCANKVEFLPHKWFFSALLNHFCWDWENWMSSSCTKYILSHTHLPLPHKTPTQCMLTHTLVEMSWLLYGHSHTCVCVCVCVCVYIYIYIYTHTHTHTHIYIYTHTHTHLWSIRNYTHVHICTYTYSYFYHDIHIHVHIHTCDTHTQCILIHMLWLQKIILL